MVSIVADIAPVNQVFDKWVGQIANVANVNLPNTSIRIPFSSVTVIATYKDQGTTRYTLTVINGEGGGKTYPPGSEVNIAADAAPAGYVFNKWVGQTANIASINMPNTIIQILFSNIAVTATYKILEIQTYTLTVTGGTGGGVYLPGTVINIVANAASSGYVFEKWMEQTNHVANINLSSTTINMPFSETTAIAIYKAQGETLCKLTVYNGDGGGNYLPGTVVDIVADVAPAGYVFYKWVGQTSHIANANIPNSTVSMPFSGGHADSVTHINLLNIITGIPMTYKFSVESDKFLLTNVKRSTDDQLHVPVGYPYGLSNYVTNFTGPRNTLYVSDLSSTLPAEGEVIGVKAWDVDGHAIPESGAVTPLKLRNHGMTVVDDTELVARFSAGVPMTYEFKVDSAKILILNAKSSVDGTITAPVIYTKGISNFVMNNVPTLNTIKISDVSGALFGSGGAITIKAWDVNGKSLVESDGAAPLKLNNHGTKSWKEQRLQHDSLGEHRRRMNFLLVHPGRSLRY